VGLVVECTRLLARRCANLGCAPRLLCAALEGALGSWNDTFCLYSRLRLAFEAAVQHAYYKLMGVDESEAMASIARRSRFYASFTAGMVKQLKGVHGSRRRWMLNVYLKLGSWLHPTANLHRASGEPPLDEKLIVETLDAIAYVMAVTSCHLLELGEAEKCRFERTARLLRRRLEG